MTKMLIQGQNAVLKLLQTAMSLIALIEEFLQMLEESQKDSQFLPGVHVLILPFCLGSSGCNVQSLGHRSDTMNIQDSQVHLTIFYRMLQQTYENRKTQENLKMHIKNFSKQPF